MSCPPIPKIFLCANQSQGHEIPVSSTFDRRSIPVSSIFVSQPPIFVSSQALLSTPVVHNLSQSTISLSSLFLVSLDISKFLTTPSSNVPGSQVDSPGE